MCAILWTFRPKCVLIITILVLGASGVPVQNGELQELQRLKVEEPEAIQIKRRVSI